MATFLSRLVAAHDRESKRRLDAGLPKLTKTDVWKAAGATSGAATHWYDGSNGMDLSTCVKVSTVLRCSPFWLYDESEPMDGPQSTEPIQASEPPSAPYQHFSQLETDALPLSVVSTTRKPPPVLADDEQIIVDGYRLAEPTLRAAMLMQAESIIERLGRRKDQAKKA